MHFQHDGLRNPSKSSLEIPKTVVPSSTALLETSKIDQRHRTGTVFPPGPGAHAGLGNSQTGWFGNLPYAHHSYTDETFNTRWTEIESTLIIDTHADAFDDRPQPQSALGLECLVPFSISSEASLRTASVPHQQLSCYESPHHYHYLSLPTSSH